MCAEAAGYDLQTHNHDYPDMFLCRFYVWFSMCFVFSLPALALALVSLLMDYTFYYVFGFFYTLFKWRWKEYSASCKVLEPYRCCLNLSLIFSDIAF